MDIDAEWRRISGGARICTRWQSENCGLWWKKRIKPIIWYKDFSLFFCWVYDKMDHSTMDWGDYQSENSNENRNETSVKFNKALNISTIQVSSFNFCIQFINVCYNCQISLEHFSNHCLAYTNVEFSTKKNEWIKQQQNIIWILNQQETWNRERFFFFKKTAKDGVCRGNKTIYGTYDLGTDEKKNSYLT